MRWIRHAMPLIVAVMTAGTAMAEDIELTSTGGEPTGVPFYSYGPSCVRGGVNLVEIVEGPAHGEAATRYTDFVPREGPCKGHTFRANALLYAPSKGFKGQDKIVIRRGFNRDDGFMRVTWRTYTIQIKVK